MAARRLALLVILGALLTAAVARTHAGDGATPDDVLTLQRAVVGAGGLHAAGAGFELDATAGQPAAGPAFSPDAGLTAGFWGAPPAALGYVYLPLTIR
jgi:hypothetical protein